ncbi:MAG TPA: polysaccharide pyruvyl transferase family protein [Clostridiales bacterium]|nr:polysaccharide pyruvyl transferase family protein [Clostridiales bacterium]
MRKKIGIMTWYQHHNYGTALQAYALAAVISSMGYKAEGINHPSSSFNRTTRLEMILSPRRVYGYFRRIYRGKRWGIFEDKKREEKFLKFKADHISLTQPLLTSSELFELNNRYDAFVCGSDQIWTLSALNTKYYLDFVTEKQKMVAYAPSLGIDHFPDANTKEIVTKQVRRFSHLSVREQSAADLLEKECGVKAEVMPDPTLLLTGKQWEELAAPVAVSKPYLLCYFLGQNEKHWRALRAVATKLGLSVVIIPVHGKDRTREHRVLNGVGPEEFLGLIQNASFVCTDSFHGILFSVLFRRPFCAFKRFSDRDKHSQNTRVYHFLREIGLEDHLYRGKPRQMADRETDWDTVQRNLLSLRAYGLAYLKKSLFEATAAETEAAFQITNTCCGCGVCSIVCPTGAVAMITEKGFYQAQVDQSKCIRCGKCEGICAFRGKEGSPIDDAHASLFMARSTLKNTLVRSTSGGVAYELSRFLNRKGLSVLGCVFEIPSQRAIHIIVPGNREDQLKQFQGLKYVQSDFIAGFSEILAQERGVVFGLPCQIAAADKLLRSKGVRNQFLLVDLICHGVPTGDLIRKHLKEIQIRYGIKEISGVDFRYKPKGWKNKFFSVYGDDRHYLKAESKDNFFLYFDLQNCYMNSCYECIYRTASCADLRLGDYWGPKYAHCHPGGVSMVISFNMQGQSLLHALAEQGILDLHEEPCADYDSVQFPKNPVIPLYRESLLGALGDLSDTRTLKDLARGFFPMPMYNRQLTGVWHKAKERIRRLKNER